MAPLEKESSRKIGGTDMVMPAVNIWPFSILLAVFGLSAAVIAAVRQGALTLAVGGIVGGNSFDVLFVAIADIGYRQGLIYHAITERQVFIISLTIILTGILLLGLLRREKHGVGNIGFENFLVLFVYLGVFLILFFSQ